MTTALPEVWLRGALPGVPALLQPVAHSLLQCREEAHEKLGDLTPGELTSRPGGAASVSYHLVHAMGSLDRLFTYARGEQLSDDQFAALRAEPAANDASSDAAVLLHELDTAVERALSQLRSSPESDLLAARDVGRGRLPSTVLGLLFHAAEHTQRHVGQAVTMARVVRGTRAA
jgi:uncharacterized damage-inducible protein DinB